MNEFQRYFKAEQTYRINTKDARYFVATILQVNELSITFVDKFGKKGILLYDNIKDTTEE